MCFLHEMQWLILVFFQEDSAPASTALSHCSLNRWSQPREGLHSAFNERQKTGSTCHSLIFLLPLSLFSKSWAHDDLLKKGVVLLDVPMAEQVGTPEQNAIYAVSWLFFFFFFLKPWCHTEGDYERGRKNPFSALWGKRPFLVQCQMDELTPKTHFVVNDVDMFNGVDVVYSHYTPFKWNPWAIL